MTDSLTVAYGDLRDGLDNFESELDEFFSYDENLTYQLRWPENSTTRPGVLVYTSPKSGAAMPDDWGELLVYSLVTTPGILY